MVYQVSVDQSVIDLDIPFRLGGFASTTIQLIGIVGVMTEVTWQVLLLVIPMAIACLWMQVIIDPRQSFNNYYEFTHAMYIWSSKLISPSLSWVYIYLSNNCP